MKNDVNMEIVKNVRGVLITRAKSGASMQEIIGDYRELVGENLQYFTLKAILDTTPGFSYTMDRGEPIYRFESRQSKHISEMVKKQKIAKKSSYGCKRKMNNSYGRNAKMARGNNNNYHSYDTNNYHSYDTNNFRNSGYLCNYQLFGDDFFLTLAGYELGSRVETAHRIHHSGLCISGQTIHDVYNRVMKMDHINPNIILNIGSVDILHGHNLFNIVSDFRMLMWAFQSRGIKPILTTLPPIGNMAHTHDYRFTVIKFNEFLMSQNIFPVIDLFQCMVDPNGKILYECYQTEARYVTGSSQPHLLWNKLGRQRILQAITKQLSTVLTFA